MPLTSSQARSIIVAAEARACDAVWEYSKPGAPAHALEFTNDGLAPFGGGVLLRTADGEVLGAGGVSGGAVAQDAEIAEAARSAMGICAGCARSPTRRCWPRR